MTTTTVVIIVSVVGLLIGLITVYLAIWSKYGLGEMIEKGFGDLRTSGSNVARDIDKRMGDLVEIIRMLVEKRGTVTYKLKNIGGVEVSVLDMGNNVTNYNIKVEQPIFTSRFLVAKANEDKEFQEKEKALFGEVRPTVHSPIPTILRVAIPSEDKEKCSEYMALLLEWLDTEYLEKKKELAEAESTISKYLKKVS